MHDALGSLEQVLARFEALTLPDETPEESRFYSYYSLPASRFAAGINAARSLLEAEQGCWTGSAKLLDVGCGIGSKMGLARTMGWTPSGVERHAPYAALCERLWPEISVWVGDAFDYDGYADFDLVYSYRLCIDDGDQAALTARIAERARPGAFLYLPGSITVKQADPVAPDLWRTPWR